LRIVENWDSDGYYPMWPSFQELGLILLFRGTMKQLARRQPPKMENKGRDALGTTKNGRGTDCDCNHIFPFGRTNSRVKSHLNRPALLIREAAVTQNVLAP